MARCTVIYIGVWHRIYDVVSMLSGFDGPCNLHVYLDFERDADEMTVTNDETRLLLHGSPTREISLPRHDATVSFCSYRSWVRWVPLSRTRLSRRWATCVRCAATSWRLGRWRASNRVHCTASLQATWAQHVVQGLYGGRASGSWDRYHNACREAFTGRPEDSSDSTHQIVVLVLLLAWCLDLGGCRWRTRAKIRNISDADWRMQRWERTDAYGSRQWSPGVSAGVLGKPRWSWRFFSDAM